MIQTEELLTVAEASRRVGVDYNDAIRTVDLDRFAKTVRVANYRLLRVEDLAEFEAAVKEYTRRREKRKKAKKRKVA